MKKGLKILIIIGIIIIVCGLIIYYINSQDVIEYKDLSKYEEYLSELRNNSDAKSRLFIFPDKIKEENVEAFQYLKVKNILDDSYLFYIIINYNDNELKKETERIKNVKKAYNGTDKYIIAVEDKLKYPTYISISDDAEAMYEYVMIDGNKIVYVFNQFFTANNKLDKKYELNYTIPRDKRDKYSTGYNMYYFYDEYGIGYMEGYEEIQVNSK